MVNVGAYFEIPVTNMERAIKFYSEIFGCEFTQETIHGNQMALFPFETNAAGVTGALAKGDTYQPSLCGTLVYLATPHIEETLAKVKHCGGEVLFPKTPVAELGFVAEFKDCEGNRVALFQRI